MRKILLLLSLFLCSLVAVAQTDFKIDVKKQRTDDMMEFTFHYNGVNKNTTFEVFKYENEAEPEKPSIKFSTLERLPDGVEATNFYQMEGGNFVLDDAGRLICVYEFTGKESYSCYLDGLDLTGSTSYQIAIKATTKDNNDNKKVETIFIRENNGPFTGNATAVSDQNDATKYSFTYGLPSTPKLSEEKATSVKLSWESDCRFGTPEFYTIYGHEMVNSETTHFTVATTTKTEYLITHLTPGASYEFFVRAYKDGAYLSASPSSNVYTPERTECLTFSSAECKNNIVTLTILEYSNGFDDNKDSYILTNGEDNIAQCTSLDAGELTFLFGKTDYNEKFRLETTIKKQDEGVVKAVGVFKLGNEGKLSTQHCDIEFDLQVTKTTQYTADLLWNNPGFDVKTATLEIINLDDDNDTPKSITLDNPDVTVYYLGNLKHSTNYKFVLELRDDYNVARAEEFAKTKVGSICGLEGTTSASSIGCGDNGFIAPYDVEFYTENVETNPTMTVRFRLDSDDEINSVSLFYGPNPSNILEFIFTIKSIEMLKGEDGWYTCTFDKLGNSSMEKGDKMYFAVMLTPAKRCSWLSLTNFYLTKSVAYEVGTGCQDEDVYRIIQFEKTYSDQSQFTLQTNGRMASVGVFTEKGYIGDDNFDLNERVYYNNFDDAPSKFTLDISEYEVGKYYMHIHDVYGEADGLKYLWAIY